VVSGKGSGGTGSGDDLLQARCPERFFHRIRVHTGRKGERRSMSEADYACLVTAAHD